MAKLSWKLLTSPKPARAPDPAVHGEGYSLVYRRRKDARYAELRWKAGAGAWTSHRLGRVPNEWERQQPELSQLGWQTLGVMTEDQLSLGNAR